MHKHAGLNSCMKAELAKQANAEDLKSSGGNTMWVRFPHSAQRDKYGRIALDGSWQRLEMLNSISNLSLYQVRFLVSALMLIVNIKERRDCFMIIKVSAGLVEGFILQCDSCRAFYGTHSGVVKIYDLSEAELFNSAVCDRWDMYKKTSTGKVLLMCWWVKVHLSKWINRSR